MRRSALLSAACALAVGCLLVSSSRAEARTISFGSGAWSWFADPRAVHFHGRHHLTYFGYVDRRGRVTVAAYDRSGQRTRTVLKDFRETDDHDNPALLLLPSGRIAAFFSHHSSGSFGYRVSRRPELIGAFGPRIEIRTNTGGNRLGFTYPNPVSLSREGGVVYLFWRGGNWMPSFSRKFPGGGWRRARTLIRGAAGHRPYMKVASTGKSTIGLAYTNSHPRERPSSVYFVKYSRGFLREPSGRRIRSLRRVPIRPAQGSVVHSWRRTRQRSWVHDVALTRSGRPVVTYAVFSRDGYRHAYYYAVWTGRRWARHRLVGAGGPITAVPRERFYSGGITLDHENPRTVYLSRQIGGYHQIEKWRTPNGGRSWFRRRLSRGRTGNFRPITPRGLHRDETDVLWMRGHYNRYENFHTSIFARIKSVRASTPPRATFHVAQRGGRVSFDAAATRGVDAPLARRHWRFGDGSEASGTRVAHRYRRPGTYFPRLTVTDAAGRRDTLIVELALR